MIDNSIKILTFDKRFSKIGVLIQISLPSLLVNLKQISMPIDTMFGARFETKKNEMNGRFRR